MEQKAKSIGKIAWSQWLTPHSLLGLETKGLVKPPQQQGLQIGSGVTNPMSAGVSFPLWLISTEGGVSRNRAREGKVQDQTVSFKERQASESHVQIQDYVCSSVHLERLPGRSVCLSKSLKKKCHEICPQVWTELPLLSIQSFQKENQPSNICFYFTEQSQGREKRCSGWPQTHDPPASAFAACSTSVVFDFSVREANWRWKKGVETGNGPVCHTD